MQKQIPLPEFSVSWFLWIERIFFGVLGPGKKKTGNRKKKNNNWKWTADLNYIKWWFRKTDNQLIIAMWVNWFGLLCDQQYYSTPLRLVPLLSELLTNRENKWITDAQAAFSNQKSFWSGPYLDFQKQKEKENRTFWEKPWTTPQKLHFKKTLWNLVIVSGA